MILMAQVVLLVMFISSIVFFISLAIAKYRMEKSERIHDANNINASGAELSNGMIRRNEGRGVIGNSRPSLTWYVRLLK